MFKRFFRWLLGEDDPSLVPPKYKVIDVDQARVLLRLAVMTKGKDFRYRLDANDEIGCCNIPLRDMVAGLPELFSSLDIDETDPRWDTGCIVGTALSLNAIPYPFSSDDNLVKISVLQEQCPEYITVKAAKYFQVAQDQQDWGHTWGESLEEAENWYRSL